MTNMHNNHIKCFVQALHFTTRSTPQPVMCGALVCSCMRYGVWDTNHSMGYQTQRWYSYSQPTKNGFPQAITLTPPPGCPRAVYQFMMDCWSVYNSHNNTCPLLCCLDLGIPRHHRDQHFLKSSPDSLNQRTSYCSGQTVTSMLSYPPCWELRWKLALISTLTIKICICSQDSQ